MKRIKDAVYSVLCVAGVIADAIVYAWLFQWLYSSGFQSLKIWITKLFYN